VATNGAQVIVMEATTTAVTRRALGFLNTTIGLTQLELTIVIEHEVVLAVSVLVQRRMVHLAVHVWPKIGAVT
jgi:hypothetical protein